jgi:hypothetical protein
MNDLRFASRVHAKSRGSHWPQRDCSLRASVRSRQLATTSIFSAVDAIPLRPSPVHHPELIRLVRPVPRQPHGPQHSSLGL